MRARLAILTLLGLLVACTSEDADPDAASRPTAESAAGSLAAGLTSGDLSAVPFEAGSNATAQAGYDEVLGDLAALSPSVVVTDVDDDAPEDTGQEDGAATAVAALTWTWDLGDEQPWTYDTSAVLSEGPDDWLITWSPALIEPSLVEGETLDLSSVTPDRGDILGADGLAIVTERDVSRVGIDKPGLTGAPAAAARTLANLVGIDPQPYVKRVKAAGDKAFVEAIVYRRDELPRGVVRGIDGIDGGRILAGTLPLAPTSDFAAPLLGRVGEVTAEMIEEDPDAYRVGDVAGLSGLQARYDELLRGTPGTVVAAVAADGARRELIRVEPTAGTALSLTLDVNLQIEAESLLADISPASALVALKPSTGEILAAANGPGNGGLNLATFGQFAPGSTFKAVSSLALIRAGLTPASTIPCTSSIVVDGKKFTNYSDYPGSGIGKIPLRTALANSCNTAFISQAGKLEGTDLFDAAVSLGLALDHDLGFPAYFGSVEPSTSKTESAAQLIGQGTILASPMVMAAVIGSVQSGALVVPRMVKGVEVTTPEGAAPLSDGEVADLQSMLRGVVTDGSGRGLADVPGPPVIAKTGTAEFGTGDELSTHAWMIAAQGDLAVAVFVEVGASGSSTAGPILETFLRAAR